jgi:hypothetical protein
MADDYGQALLNVDVRPIRVAYAVAEGSRDDFRAAVLEASSRWGGIAEPILPIGSDGRVLPEWLPLLDLAPVDFVCAISRPKEEWGPLREQVGRDVVTLEQIQPGFASLHATAVQPVGGRPSNMAGARPNDPIATLAALGAPSDEAQRRAWQEAGRNFCNR